MSYLSWKSRPDVVEEVVRLRDEGLTFRAVTELINERYNMGATTNAVNNIYRHSHKGERPSLKQTVETAIEKDLPNYKETVEIAADGSHKSDKLLKMSDEQMKDTDFLLEAHGYDVEAWELVTARNNIWNSYSKQDGIMTMYASKITVKPRTSTFSMQKVIDAIKTLPSTILPVETHYSPVKYLLEIPLFDSHFGVSTYDDYKETQKKILGKISRRNWEQILFIVGQDMLHNDNFRGQTSSGTQIEQVDMTQAWADALKFYSELIEEALMAANHVKLIFSKGNHDESMSWAFVQLLKHKYPQLDVDDSFVERKAHVFGHIFLGITHGDKARKNLDKIFPKEFPMLWARAKNHEIHTGHFHVEDAKDVFGMMVRTLATRNKTDQWHKDNGFVGAHKRFMLFEYSEEELESIHYV